MKKTKTIFGVTLAPLLMAQAWTAAGAEITGGPMPGYPATRTAQIWLQVDGPARAVIEYWPEGRPGDVKLSAPQPLTEAEDYTAHLAIGGLEPGQTYEYRVRLDGAPQPTSTTLRFHTQPLWKWRTEPPDFTVALGSCAYINERPYDRPGEPYGAGHEIFDTIAASRPDLMLWLGDNIYLREADFDSPWGMNYRYRHVRSFLPLQRLLSGTHHVATWDDHDFGPNNSNGSAVFKATALDLFKRYWANPGYGLPETPGVFTAVPYADVEFFLLDDRYHRQSDNAPDAPTKTMLGAAQLQWLKDALLASEATYKFIANGSQILFGKPGVESWVNFPAERSGFLAWLEQSKVKGVILLSGDRHLTRLVRLDRGGLYPLYELTCSPLTSGVRDPAKDVPSALFVKGTEVGERNFCTLGFSGPKDQRTLRMQVHSTKGKLLWERSIPARELD